MENKLSPELPDLMDFVGLKKKKKIRFPKVDFFQDSSKEDLIQYSPSEDTDRVPNTIPIEVSPVTFDELLETDLSFDLMKKKKKKKVNIEDAILNITDEEDLPVKSATPLSSLVVNDRDANYTYEDLLLRVFIIMREKDPFMDQENRKKLVMKPPQMIRIGTKKSSFINFLEICKILHRSPTHLQQFLLVELGTTGSVDGNYQLIIKGRFEQRQIENVLRRYIKEYVTCHTCKSPDTTLQKDTRLFFLQCESCGSRCSVTSVKSGFQAVTGKRAAMRAKTS